MKRADFKRKLEPLACFSRGVLAGTCLLQALQLLTPDLLVVHLWPWWARAVAGTVFLLLGWNYILAQRGFMLGERRSLE